MCYVIFVLISLVLSQYYKSISGKKTWQLIRAEDTMDTDSVADPKPELRIRIQPDLKLLSDQDPDPKWPGSQIWIRIQIRNWLESRIRIKKLIVSDPHT